MSQQAAASDRPLTTLSGGKGLFGSSPGTGLEGPRETGAWGWGGGVGSRELLFSLVLVLGNPPSTTAKKPAVAVWTGPCHLPDSFMRCKRHSDFSREQFPESRRTPHVSAAALAVLLRALPWVLALAGPLLGGCSLRGLQKWLLFPSSPSRKGHAESLRACLAWGGTGLCAG